MYMTNVIKVEFCLNRFQIGLLGLLLIAVVYQGCHQKVEGAMTVAALNGPSGLSLVKMMHDQKPLHGSHKENYIIKNDPELIKAMMLGGKADLVLAPFTMAALLYNKGVPYQLVGVPVWGSLFVIGSDTSITSIEQLRDANIHSLPRNMTPDIVFRHLLLKNDIDPDTDLLLEYTFPTPFELSGALETKQIDMAVLPEPMASRVLMRNGALGRLLDLTELWNEQYSGNPPLAQTALMVKRSWALQNPALLDSWCKRYAQAIEWTNGHTNEVGVLAVNFNIARDPAIVANAIEGCKMHFEYAFGQKEALMDYFRILHGIDSRIVGNKIPDEDFFYKK
jgi:NitT/TauT family transport system substrate-binding protein